VAVYYEVPRHTPLRGPLPIGRACEHYEARVVNMDGGLQPPGEIGQLQLRGAALMTGYWNQPQWQTEKTSPATDGGRPWYRTGDLVVSLPSGELQYAGRIGRMIKLRGYRVEPAEIEARLYQHSAIYEVGVVPVERPGGLQL